MRLPSVHALAAGSRLNEKLTDKSGNAPLVLQLAGQVLLPGE